MDRSKNLDVPSVRSMGPLTSDSFLGWRSYSSEEKGFLKTFLCKVDPIRWSLVLMWRKMHHCSKSCCIVEIPTYHEINFYHVAIAVTDMGLNKLKHSWDICLR
jgi:hypothetical protein